MARNEDMMDWDGAVTWGIRGEGQGDLPNVFDSKACDGSKTTRFKAILLIFLNYLCC